MTATFRLRLIQDYMKTWTKMYHHLTPKGQNSKLCAFFYLITHYKNRVGLYQIPLWLCLVHHHAFGWQQWEQTCSMDLTRHSRLPAMDRRRGLPGAMNRRGFRRRPSQARGILYCRRRWDRRKRLCCPRCTRACGVLSGERCDGDGILLLRLYSSSTGPLLSCAPVRRTYAWIWWDRSPIANRRFIQLVIT